MDRPNAVPTRPTSPLLRTATRTAITRNVDQGYCSSVTTCHDQENITGPRLLAVRLAKVGLGLREQPYRLGGTAAAGQPPGKRYAQHTAQPSHQPTPRHTAQARAWHGMPPDAGGCACPLHVTACMRSCKPPGPRPSHAQPSTPSTSRTGSGSDGASLEWTATTPHHKSRPASKHAAARAAPPSYTPMPCTCRTCYEEMSQRLVRTVCTPQRPGGVGAGVQRPFFIRVSCVRCPRHFPQPRTQATRMLSPTPARAPQPRAYGGMASGCGRSAIQLA